MNSTPQAGSARARFLVIAAVLFLILSLHLPAGGRRRAVAAPLPSDALAIAFVDAPGGTLDAGSIAWNGRRGKIRGGDGAAIAKRTFGIRIGRPSREAQGSATLRAFLETADPRCIVRLDGIVLGTQPRIIERFSPIGIITTHRLEIEVAASAPEGALVTTIGWDVTTE